MEKEKNIIKVKLIFEGEYLDGKKHGKGKEYNNDGELFEVEYLKGKKWNGKGYNNNGEIEFELQNECGKIKEFIIMMN